MLAQHGTNRKSYRCTAPCQYSTGYAANLRKHQRLFCKYRQQNTGGSGAVPGRTPPQREGETETGCCSSSVPGISRAVGTDASGYSGNAGNGFRMFADSHAV